MRNASCESPYVEEKFKNKVVTNNLAVIAPGFSLLYGCKVILKYKYIKDRGRGKGVILQLNKYSGSSVKEHH